MDIFFQLDKKVQFKSKKPEFAQFHFEHGTGSYSVVGWNDMESSGMRKALVKIPGFVGNPNQYEDGFYINLCTPKYDLTYVGIYLYKFTCKYRC